MFVFFRGVHLISGIAQSTIILTRSLNVPQFDYSIGNSQVLSMPVPRGGHSNVGSLHMLVNKIDVKGSNFEHSVTTPFF